MVALERESERHVGLLRARLRDHTKQGMPAYILIKVEKRCESAVSVSDGSVLCMYVAARGTDHRSASWEDSAMMHVIVHLANARGVLWGWQVELVLTLTLEKERGSYKCCGRHIRRSVGWHRQANECQK